MRASYYVVYFMHDAKNFPTDYDAEVIMDNDSLVYDAGIAEIYGKTVYQNVYHNVQQPKLH